MATLDNTAGLPAPIAQIFALDGRRKMALLTGIALAIALLVGSWMWSRAPDYAVLFANVSEKDGGAILQALTQQNVPYRFNEGGGAILVPSDRVHDVRLRLASQGLPRGGHVGFELMDGLKLGVSQFAEQVSYQRALEGELARSIQTLSAVAGVRVHLAIPRQSGFLRNEEKPSASVVVNLHPGRKLEPAQIAGIVHLVAAGVPELSASQVTVVDQSGNLVYAREGGDITQTLDANQLKHRREIETSAVQRIESILQPIMGAGNVRAQVAADIDFDQVEQTAERYKPNQAGEASIRSQQVNETSQAAAGPGGVPGALSNQPPAPATAPIVQPSGGTGTPATASAGNGSGGRRDSTTNYELDKTVQHTKQSVGKIRRLSVAVVVNHKVDTLPDGKTKSSPLSAAEIKQITDLVKEAVGFDAERGDTVNVANSPFRQGLHEQVADTPLWRDPGVIGTAKEVGRLLLFLAIVAIVFLKVLKPLVKSVLEGAKQHARRDAPDDTPQLPGQQELIPAYEQKLLSAREMAKSDPKLVASVIREWVGGHE